jgi:nucleoid DNA-binding protein|tara:strand:- start:2056 stop:2283 length:228 start_codon:yes stop_codon:yes gene_type:complete
MKTSKDIIDSISESNSFSKQTIRKVVNKTFEEIKERLSKDEKIMLRGFMKFVCASKKKTKTYSIEDYQKLKTKNK